LALGETGDKDVMSLLKTMLADPEEKVRKNAAKALGLLEFLPREEEC
jgi:HEAT repeat protein